MGDATAALGSLMANMALIALIITTAGIIMRWSGWMPGWFNAFFKPAAIRDRFLDLLLQTSFGGFLFAGGWGFAAAIIAAADARAGALPPARLLGNFMEVGNQIGLAVHELIATPSLFFSSGFAFVLAGLFLGDGLYAAYCSLRHNIIWQSPKRKARAIANLDRNRPWRLPLQVLIGTLFDLFGFFLVFHVTGRDDLWRYPPFWCGFATITGWCLIDCLEDIPSIRRAVVGGIGGIGIVVLLDVLAGISFHDTILPGMALGLAAGFLAALLVKSATPSGPPRDIELIDDAISGVLAMKAWPNWGSKVVYDENGLPVLLLSEVRRWPWMRRRRACFIHVGDAREEIAFVEVQAGSFFAPFPGVALPFGNAARLAWILCCLVLFFPSLLWVAFGGGFRTNGAGRAEVRPWRALESFEQTDTVRYYDEGHGTAFCWRRRHQYVPLAHFGAGAPSLEVSSATFNRAEMAELHRRFVHEFIDRRQAHLARLGRSWMQAHDGPSPLTAPKPPRLQLPAPDELGLVAGLLALAALPLLSVMARSVTQPAGSVQAAGIPAAASLEDRVTARKPGAVFEAARLPVQEWAPARADALRFLNTRAPGSAIFFLPGIGNKPRFLTVTGARSVTVRPEKEHVLPDGRIAYLFTLENGKYVVVPEDELPGAVQVHRDGTWITPR